MEGRLQTATSDSSERAADPSLIWSLDILGKIAPHLTCSNDLASLRFVSKAAAAQFKPHVEVHLSRPVPAFVEFWSQSGACYNLNLAQREQLASCAFRDVATLTVALAAADLPDHRHLRSNGGYDISLFRGWYGELEGLRQGVTWRQLFLLGAEHGSRAICEWCLQQCPDVPQWSKILDDRDFDAREALCQLIRTSYAFVSAACQAARSGHVDLLGWLLREASQLAEAEAQAEAVGEAWGREEARKYLVPSALVGCDLPTVLQLWDWCGLETPADVPAGWASGGWRHVVASALRSPRNWRQKAEWVVERATEMRQLALKPTVDLFEAAFRPFPGHTAEDAEQRLAWLEGQGCRPGTVVLSSAIRAGDMRAYRLLRSRGVSLHSVISDREQFRGVITAAAEAGHLGMLQELRARASRAAVGWGREQWDAALNGATSGGRLTVLEWAVGCMTAEELRNIRKDEVFRSAARSGSVAAMTWALEHGCGADEEAWSCAVESGCEAAVDFLTSLGCPDPGMGEPYEEALERMEWRLLLALHWAGLSFGPDRPRLYARALARGAPPGVLQWLEKETGVDPQEGAAEVKGLYACCCEICELRPEWLVLDKVYADEEMEAKAGKDVEAEVERARRRHERGRW